MSVDDLEIKSNSKDATQFAPLSNLYKIVDIISMSARNLAFREAFYLILLLLLLGFLFAVPLLTMIW